MGVWAYGRMGVWAYGRMGVWAYGLMGVWARFATKWLNRIAQGFSPGLGSKKDRPDGATELDAASGHAVAQV
jgi:hypothetical protein